MQFFIFECIKLAFRQCTVLYIHSNQIVSNSDGSTFLCVPICSTRNILLKKTQQNETTASKCTYCAALRLSPSIHVFSDFTATRLASECALWVSSALMRCCSVGLVSDGPCVPSASSVISGLRAARHHLCCFSIPCLQFQSNPTSHADARAQMMRSASAAAETCLYE